MGIHLHAAANQGKAVEDQDTEVVAVEAAVVEQALPLPEKQGVQAGPQVHAAKFGHSVRQQLGHRLAEAAVFVAEELLIKQ